MSEALVYVGKDLEAMAFAQNYHQWILNTFAPYLGARIVEVGAGTGGFSELLLQLSPDSLDLVEPAEGMYNILVERLSQAEHATQLVLHNSSFDRVAEELRATRKPDSILYVNVLEHVEDDNHELRRVFQTLTRKGRLFIFVPAFQWLSGSFDQKVGHFRRYTRAELVKKTQDAGFKVIESRYFDLVGILPWWLKYRLLRSDKLETRTVRIYDRFIVPVARKLESVVTPPVGKNLLLIAQKE